MTTKYTYSFVVYAFNQQEFISDAVRAAVMQDCQPIEIVLSDDCSDDETFDVMRSTMSECNSAHRVVLNRNERNQGLIGHVNSSHDIASGDILIAAAGDDISHPDRARRIIQLFESSDALLVHSLVNPIDGDGRPVPNVDPRGLFTKSSITRPLTAATAMSLYVGASSAWSKVLFEKFGPIRHSHAYEDSILGFRAALEGRVGFIDDRLLDYRVGGCASENHELTATSLQEHRQKRLLKHKRESAILDQRLHDCHTFGLDDKDSIVVHIQRALSKSRLAAKLLESKPSTSFSKFQFGNWSSVGLRPRIRELAAVIKWRVTTLRGNDRRLRLGIMFPSLRRFQQELIRIVSGNSR